MTKILAFPDALPQAQQLAQVLDCTCSALDIHRFPDGESLLTLPETLPQTVVLFRSLNDPDSKLIELYLAIATARDLGCHHLILVAPYLCYMRQDKVFAPGQGISQRYIGDLLSSWLDGVVTVDPHLHRIHDLGQAFPHCVNRVVSAAPLLGKHLKEHFLRGHDGNGFLVGPDEESRQWVAQVAAESGLGYLIAIKERFGDRDVRVTLPPYDCAGKTAILVDDMISSGNTMVEAAKQLRARGASDVIALCTHALLAPGAEQAMTSVGISQVLSSNAVPHASNRIDLSPLLAEAVKEVLEALLE
ncbi:MAG: ribose-phosphate diphosphokinase [Porticoccaceae bacterium]